MPSESKQEYYAPLHGNIVDLASGAVLAPGERVKLTNKEADEPANKASIEAGRLIKVEKGGES